MKHKYYKVHVRHDAGQIRFKVWATDADHASQLVQRAEGCPPSAIRFVSPYIAKGA